MEINHFINTIIEEDIRSGKHKRAITRFPPEPNGFLHLGHARAIITNWSMADQPGTVGSTGRRSATALQYLPS